MTKTKDVVEEEVTEILRSFAEEKQEALKAQRAEILGKIEKLIIEEMLICRKENQPTSRLSSLFNKLKEIKGQ